jgi:hypothetical protein
MTNKDDMKRILEESIKDFIFFQKNNIPTKLEIVNLLEQRGFSPLGSHMILSELVEDIEKIDSTLSVSRKVAKEFTKQIPIEEQKKMMDKLKELTKNKK